MLNVPTGSNRRGVLRVVLESLQLIATDTLRVQQDAIELEWWNRELQGREEVEVHYCSQF